jgi:protein-tyrosine phosphatase
MDTKTWWIDRPHLLGSGNPCTADLERLRDGGFSVLVSLLSEEEEAPRYDIARARALGYERHNIALKWFCPPTVDQLEQFVKLVDESPAGTKMIVHCNSGNGRTGTFGAAYWVTKGMMAADAIMHVLKANCHAVETPEQERVLAEFALIKGSNARGTARK